MLLTVQKPLSFSQKIKDCLLSWAQYDCFQPCWSPRVFTFG